MKYKVNKRAVHQNYFSGDSPLMEKKSRSIMENMVPKFGALPDKISIHDFSVTKNSPDEPVPLPGIDPAYDAKQQKILAQQHRESLTKAGFPGGKLGVLAVENVVKHKVKKSLLKRGLTMAAKGLGNIASLPVQAFFFGMPTAYAPNKPFNNDYEKEMQQKAYAAENKGLTEKEIRMKEQLAALKNLPVSGKRPSTLSQGK
tara:strand:- start:41 stop:643 length:603 start_codon:yes stop_codon:yes gene_type:complete